MTPQLRIPIGVVAERRKAISPWADMLWRPVAALAGLPDTAPWTRLAGDDQRATYYAGPGEIALYRSEAENYRRNLASEVPSIWLALHEADGEPPFAVGGATADPAEGEAWSETGHTVVEAVAMPEPVRAAVAAFVALCPPAPPFEKRRRDAVDPHTPGRRPPPGRTPR